MLENVKQATIGPLIDRTIAKGTLVYTDEYDIYSRLVEWGYGHETVCHAAGSSPGMTTETDSARCMSTRSKGSGRCCVVAPPSPRDPAGEPAAVPGILRVRSQRPGARKEAVGCPDRPIGGTTPESIMSQNIKCPARLVGRPPEADPTHDPCRLPDLKRWCLVSRSSHDAFLAIRAHPRRCAPALLYPPEEMIEGVPRGSEVGGDPQARISRTTRPATSVRRKSRPA